MLSAPATLSPLDQLMAATHGPRHALVAHPLYARLSELTLLQSFMRSHVFAVWDFMSLLKTLQRRLTCVDVPWMPPADIVCARWINEIVLGEETDEVRPGEYRSHFDLYLEAMGEAGADSLPVRRMLEALRAGAPVPTALEHAPSAAREFVRHTLALTQASTHEVAAAFLLGREHLLPSVFEHMLQAVLPLGGSTASLRLYLERHILLDGGEHGDHAAALLTRLCGGDARKWHEAEGAALSSLRARQALWDGVLRS
jgi:hypothetical protein